MAGSQPRSWRRLSPRSPGNYYGFEDSQWNDPAQPCCAICGQLILADPNARNFFSQVEEFDAASGRRNYIKLTVSQIHEFLAEKKCDWRSTYRASKYTLLSKFSTCFKTMIAIIFFILSNLSLLINKILLIQSLKHLTVRNLSSPVCPIVILDSAGKGAII